MALSLKEALLGRSPNGDGAADQPVLEQLMESCGLTAHLNAAEMRELIAKTVIPPVALSLQGSWEIAAQSARFALPTIFHGFADDRNLVEDCGKSSGLQDGRRTRQPSFLLATGSGSLRAGASQSGCCNRRVETLDCVHTRWRNEPENLDALIEAGLVDTCSGPINLRTRSPT